MFIKLSALRLTAEKFCHHFRSKNINCNRRYVNVDNSKAFKRICDIKNTYLNSRRKNEI